MGLFAVALSDYIVQACQLSRFSRRLVAVYAGSGFVGLVYASVSLVVRHPYITQVFMGTISIVLIFTIVLIPILYWQGVRLRVWNMLSLSFVLPAYAYFSGRNAGLLPGTIQEEMLIAVFQLSFLAEPSDDATARRAGRTPDRLYGGPVYLARPAPRRG
ncbi:MAG: hypothetical protein LH609_23840 [Rudanella sp.]|nr:hypothetical protein [Rudanella sp.]